MTREPTEDERRRIEFYCKRVMRAISGAPISYCLTALRLVVCMVIERGRTPEIRAAVLDDFCTELRREIRKGMQ